MKEKIIDEILNGETPEENIKLEYKSFKYAEDTKEINKNILKVIISFANKEGGLLIIGINDKDKKIEKQPAFLSKKIKVENISTWIDDSLSGEIEFDISNKDLNNFKCFFIEVKSAKNTIFYKNTIIVNNEPHFFTYTRLNGRIKKITISESAYNFLTKEKFKLIKIDNFNEWNEYIVNSFKEIFLNEKSKYLNPYNSNRENILKIIESIKEIETKKVKEIFSNLILYLSEFKDIDHGLIPDIQIQILKPESLDIFTIFKILKKKYTHIIEEDLFFKNAQLKFENIFTLVYEVNSINTYNKIFEEKPILKNMRDELEKIEWIHSPYENNFNKENVKNVFLKINKFLENVKKEILKISKNKFNGFFDFNNDNLMYQTDILSKIFTESFIESLFLYRNKDNEINTGEIFNKLSYINKFINKKLRSNRQEFILFQNMILIYKVINEIFMIKISDFHSNQYGQSFGIENFLNKLWIFYNFHLKLVRENFYKTFISFFHKNYFTSLNNNYKESVNLIFNNILFIWNQIDPKFFLSTFNDINLENLTLNIKKGVTRLIESFDFTPDKNLEILPGKFIIFSPKIFFLNNEIKDDLDKLSIFDPIYWEKILNLFETNKSDMLEKALTNDGDFSFFGISEKVLEKYIDSYEIILNIKSFEESDSSIKKYVIEYCNEKYENNWKMSLENYYLAIYNRIIKFNNDYNKILYVLNDYKERLFELYNPEGSIKINLNLSIEDFLKDYFEDVNNET